MQNQPNAQESAYMQTRPNKDIPYLKLDEDIEKSILEDRRSNRGNPYKFHDEDIVRRFDFPHDAATITRPAFIRDVEKIVNTPAYNRYAGKTQVFSFVENDDITRRGLHIQLVNRVAQGIGSLLGLNTDLIEAIALGHDVGHTPFGHAGERFLSKCYNERTGKFFHHNVHSVRVLDQLYPRNISLQTLDGVLKHNGEFAQQMLMRDTLNSFEELDALVQQCEADESVIKDLRPATLEGCVVRVSDMIAYVGKDRADALDMGILDSIDIFDSEIIGKDNSRILNNLTVDIVNNSYGKDHIEMSRQAFDDLKLAKKQNYQIIYSKEGMIDNTSNIVEKMFEEMYSRLLDDLLSENMDSPIFEHHIKSLVKNSHSITTEDYLQQEPNRIVVDYIASMTDSYFINLYEYLFPESQNRILTRDYCSDLKRS